MKKVLFFLVVASILLTMISGCCDGNDCQKSMGELQREADKAAAKAKREADKVVREVKDSVDTALDEDCYDSHCVDQSGSGLSGAGKRMIAP